MIEDKVRESDVDADRWFDHPIAGHKCACNLRLSQDYGSCVINVRVSLPELQCAQAEIALYVCQCFYLRTEE